MGCGWDRCAAGAEADVLRKDAPFFPLCPAGCASSAALPPDPMQSLPKQLQWLELETAMVVKLER